MRKALKLLLPLAVLAISAGLAMWMMASRESPAPPEPPALPAVKVVEVKALDVIAELSSRGVVEAHEQVRVSSQIAGQIIALSPQLEIGLEVTAGEWLVSIDDADFRLEVERLESEVVKARLDLHRKILEHELAASEWAELGELAGDPIALRAQEVKAARAAVDAAAAGAQRARLDLSRCRIHAPSGGRVEKRSVTLGGYVAEGQTLASLLNLDHGEIRLPIAADEVAFLPSIGSPEAPNLPVLVTSAAGNTWRGIITRSEGQLDRRSRVLYLVARVEDPFRDRDKRLEIGELVQARIPGRRLESVIAVPRSSLRTPEQVLVVEQGRLLSRRVHVVRVQSDLALVSEGLEAGEKVCVTPLEAFAEAMEVAPVVVEGVDPARLASDWMTGNLLSSESSAESAASAAQEEASIAASSSNSSSSGGALSPSRRFALIDFEMEATSKNVKISVRIDPEAPRRQFMLRSPWRYVVDFQDTRLHGPPRTLSLGDLGVVRARVAEHQEQGMTRLVFDLEAEMYPQISADGERLSISFEAASP